MSKDHVILPKSSLMQFSISGKFCYLDLKAKKICSALAETYNAEENYYPADKEKYLSGKIETVIGRLRKQLGEFTNTKTEITLSPNIKEEVIRCLAIQQLRIPSFIKYIRSQSIFAEQFNLPDKFYSPLHRDGDKLINIAIERYNKTFYDYDVNVCVINENSPFSFILPTSHYLSTRKNILLVLSPYRAIILLPKEDNKKYYAEDGTLGYLHIKKYSEIEPLYLEAIETELKNEHSRIIGLKSQLEILLNVI